MSKNLRSAGRLPGNIGEYLLENRDNMPEENDTGNETNLQSMMQDLSGDPSKLCELLVKNLSLANESNQQMQKLLLDKQTNSASDSQRIKYAAKLDDCPTKGKYSSLEAWLLEVELWDESNSGNDVENISSKKYLKFMNSVNVSEECEDLKKLVQVEFKENKSFNKKSPTIIKDIVKVIKDKFDKTDLKKCSDAWIKFMNIKQEENCCHETSHCCGVIGPSEA